MESPNPVTRTTIMLFTDEPLAALGATCLISSRDDFQIVGGPVHIVDLLPALQRERPGILLIDLGSEVTIALLARLHEAVPECRIVLWARRVGEEMLQQARDIGIAGIVRHNLSNEDFIQQLLQVVAGTSSFDSPAEDRCTKIQLTPRESQVVTLLAQGLKNKEIAACLGLTEGTVKSYLVTLFQKVGARDRFELTVLGLKNAYCGQASWDGHGGFVTGREEVRARPALRSLVLVEPRRKTGYPENAVKAAGR
jgi:DNA-binding NarL/FixJ family response regulator